MTGLNVGVAAAFGLMRMQVRIEHSAIWVNPAAGTPGE